MSTLDYQKILENIKSKNLIGKSQNFIAKELGISRHAVKKALSDYSSADDKPTEPLVDDSVVTMTDNGCVSLTPTSAAPAAVGDVLKNEKTDEKVIVVLVNQSEKLISYMPVTVLYLEDDNKAEGGETAFDYERLVKINTINFKSFKRKQLKHQESDHRFIHTQASATTSGLFLGGVDTCVGNSTELWYNKFKDEFNADVTLIKSSKPDSSIDSEDTEGEAEEAQTDNSENASTIKKLKSDGCPYKLTVSTRSINVISDGCNYSITADEKLKFGVALEAAEQKDWVRLLELCKLRHQKAVDISKTLSSFGFTVSNGYVVMGDKTGQFKLGGVDVLMRRIEAFAVAGDENGVTSMAKFLDKLLENPDEEIMNRIIDFIRYGDVEVDEEGYLITYKYVNSDYKDSHSGRLDNRPGSVVRMKRILVDKNINNKCSQGLHVCALSYVFGFWGPGKRLLKVRLNPRDIVAIPKDYKGAKIRCSEYTVISDVTEQFLKRQLPVDFKGIFKGV